MSKCYAIGTTTDGRTIRYPVWDDNGFLDCSCDDLISLDLSGCLNIRSLFCENNYLTSLDVSKCEDLATLECFNNCLTSLDISNCIELTDLKCNNIIDIDKINLPYYCEITLFI